MKSRQVGALLIDPEGRGLGKRNFMLLKETTDNLLQKHERS